MLIYHLDPVPAPETLRAWFTKSKVRQHKPNPLAKRGGGAVYYAVADVEKLLQQM